MASLEWADMGAYLSVFFLSSVKFLFGLIGGIGAKFEFWELIAVVGGGAWTGSWFFAFFGTAVRKWISKHYKRKKPLSFHYRRRIVKIWKRYGMAGISFLSIVLSPMIAIGVAVSFQEPPLRIMAYMTVAIFFWCLMFALGHYWFQEWFFI